MGRPGPHLRRLSTGLSRHHPLRTQRPATSGMGVPASIYVFARGNNGALYERIISPTGAQQITQTDSSTYTLSGWTSLGGQLATNTGPSVCSWGPGRLDVLYKARTAPCIKKCGTARRGPTGTISAGS